MAFIHRTTESRGKVREVVVNQSRALELLEAYGMNRDPQAALSRLKANVYAQLAVDDGVIYFDPNR